METGWRRNGCSYVLWLLYTLIMGAALALIVVRLCVNAGYAEAFGVVIGLLLLFVCAGLTLGTSAVRKRVDALDPEVHVPVEILLVIVLVAVGVFLRAQEIPLAEQETWYFQTACVTAGESTVRTAHGIVDLYVRLLHFYFFVFGNKLQMAIWLQIIMQCVAFVLLYIGARRANGRLGAFIFLGFALFAPSLRADAVILSPRAFFGLLYAVGILLAEESVRQQKIWLFLLTGAYIGILSELDAMGLSLGVFLIGLTLWTDAEWESFPQRLLWGGTELAGSASAFAIGLFLKAGYLSCNVAGAARLWIGTYQEKGFSLTEHFFGVLISGEGMLLLFVLCVGIFSFWCSRRDYLGIWMLCAASVILSGIAGFYSAEIPFGQILYVSLMILGGVSMHNLIFGKNEDRKKLNSDFVAKEVLFNDVADSSAQKNGNAVQTTMEKNGQNTKSQNTGAQNTGMIENPLPVPKHRKRPMLDYDIDSIAGKDFYDVKVPDNDDYDIK